MDRVVRRTPWWAISAGLHLTLALVLGWMIVLGRPAESEESIVVRRHDPPPPAPEFPRQPEAKPSAVRAERPVTDPVPSEEREPQPDDPEPKPPVKDPSETFDPRKPPSRDRIGSGRPPGGTPGTLSTRRLKRVGTPDGDGPTKDTEDAVRRALLWIARHQDPDGPWRTSGHVRLCRGNRCAPNEHARGHDVGNTALALLAFLGAGYTHQSRDLVAGIPFGDVVRKGLQWLLDRQAPDGSLDRHMYDHAFATLALTEACAMTSTVLFRDRAQAAVDWLVAARNPGSGWRYSYRSGDVDTSVTGAAVMALKSAQFAGLSFPAEAFDSVRAWLDEVTEPDYHRAGYTNRAPAKVTCPHNQAYENHEARTAIAVMSRIFIDRDAGDRRVTGGASVLTRDLPRREPMAVDYYYWYYASLALYQVDGYRNGPHWQKWNPALTAALVKSQNPDSAGCRAGSWEPNDRWSCEGGRVYATAMNALTLEVYYRYPSVFGGPR